ncbi:hypothetical protein ROA7745_00871 [Roseovarius aestuarii]|uniref:Uncharacterized protein n=1 Tax=Roseovarius aestuarii TaxID=475083 RepID=A0A1X7BN62_9RHOB|nr:hypothetical protein ROA7745_00871 [Roseovarius aestuarii]
MNFCTTEGSARAWGRACNTGVSRDIAKIVTFVPVETSQKRPPVGRVGRCPGKSGGVDV